VCLFDRFICYIKLNQNFCCKFSMVYRLNVSGIDRSCVKQFWPSTHIKLLLQLQFQLLLLLLLLKLELLLLMLKHFPQRRVFLVVKTPVHGPLPSEHRVMSFSRDRPTDLLVGWCLGPTFLFSQHPHLLRSHFFGPRVFLGECSLIRIHVHFLLLVYALILRV